MTFRSILFDESEVGTNPEQEKTPDFFHDLNLDQVVASFTAGRDEYRLEPFFFKPLRDARTINYRYDVMRDLENPALLAHIHSFAQRMRAMRDHLAQVEKLHYKLQKQSWFVDAVNIYCGAVRRLSQDLNGTDLRSRGFIALCAYLTDYTSSESFTELATETEEIRANLCGLQYCVYITGDRIRVSRYKGEADHSAQVLSTFEKFKQGAAAKDYRFNFPCPTEMDHVEAAILDMVARLYPEVFTSLKEHFQHHRNFLDQAIGQFDREIQFYVACLELVERYRKTGLRFCYPTVTDQSKEVYGREAFDLALANKLLRENAETVTNDFYLTNPERVFVVSGPNQGGKTTFARTFGQLHYLASIGCPVPGSAAKLFIFDKLFTHFESEEDIRNRSGKLEDDLLRIHRILEQATSNCILIMNESFVSTTLKDALFLSKEIMRQIIRRDMLCVSVTFLDELASLSDTTVSMVSTVYPEDPARRTFKVVRKPPDGLAYATAIAERYHLTYESVKRRITS